MFVIVLCLLIGNIERFWSDDQLDFGRQLRASIQLRSRSWTSCSWIVHRTRRQRVSLAAILDGTCYIVSVSSSVSNLSNWQNSHVRFLLPFPTHLPYSSLSPFLHRPFSSSLSPHLPFPCCPYPFPSLVPSLPSFPLPATKRPLKSSWRVWGAL